MRIPAAALLAVLIPVASLAQSPAPDAAAPAMTAAAMPAGAPPAGAMKLSAVLAGLETSVGDSLAYVDELDWDRDGYWEVEYYTTDNRKTKVRLDAMTGQPRN